MGYSSKNAAVFALSFLMLSSILDPLSASTAHRSSEVAMNVQILGLESESGSLPAQAQKGSVMEVTVYMRNTGEEARTFHVGASIIGEGENEWKDLPGWRNTPLVKPGEVYAFTFGKYTIPTDAYQGYHGIVAKVWTDSSRRILIAERWFPRVVALGELPVANIALSFDFESDGESYKSTGYVGNSTLDTMGNIIDLLTENEIPATIFVQGACLDHHRSGNEFCRLIELAHSKGLEIASHSYSHPTDISSLSESEIENELMKTEDLLQRTTGEKPVGFRAPYFACGESLWNILVGKGYQYDSSVWQQEPTVYIIETPSGLLTQVPWKHQDGDTSYSDLSRSVEYAASYGKTRVVDFHPQIVREYWREFVQFITLVRDLRSEGRIETSTVSQLAQAAPLPWEDGDRDNIPNYLDKSAFSVSTLKGSLGLFDYDWHVSVHAITPATDTDAMLSALQEEGVQNLGSYENVVPVIVDVRFPFSNVDDLLAWLASRGIVDYGEAIRFRSQIESLFSSDGHMRIAVVLKWNSLLDWDVEYYSIRDQSPFVWKLYLVSFLLDYAPVFIGVGAYAYQLLVKKEPINPQDVLTEALAMAIHVVVMQAPTFGLFAKGMVWAVTFSKSVTDLLIAIQDPRLDLHLLDSRGEKILGIDYESGRSLTTSEYGIYFGPSRLSQYMITTKPIKNYRISVVSQWSEEIEYNIFGIDLTTNDTIVSSGNLAPSESIGGRVYLDQNVVHATRLIMSVTLADSEIYTNERMMLNIHLSNENGTSVSDARVIVQLNNTMMAVENQGDGFYESIIEGSQLSPGNYILEVFASKEGMLEDMRVLTITLSTWPLYEMYPYLVLISVSVLAFAIVLRKRKKSTRRGDQQHTDFKTIDRLSSVPSQT